MLEQKLVGIDEGPEQIFEQVLGRSVFMSSNKLFEPAHFRIGWHSRPGSEIIFFHDLAKRLRFSEQLAQTIVDTGQFAMHQRAVGDLQSL